MSGIRKTGILLMTAMVLLSTTGFTVWHHICGGAHGHSACKEVPLYFKASIVAVPQVKKEFIPVLAAECFIVMTPAQEESFNEGSLHGISDREPPPRLAGKSLVYFLHQPRIPFAS